jgi:hypothetical protein
VRDFLRTWKQAIRDINTRYVLALLLVIAWYGRVLVGCSDGRSCVCVCVSQREQVLQQRPRRHGDPEAGAHAAAALLHALPGKQQRCPSLRPCVRAATVKVHRGRGVVAVAVAVAGDRAPLLPGLDDGPWPRSHPRDIRGDQAVHAGVRVVTVACTCATATSDMYRCIPPTTSRDSCTLPGAPLARRCHSTAAARHT